MKQLILITMFAFVFAACGKDEPRVGGGSDESIELRLGASIKVQSKAAGDIWDANDLIGVYIKTARGSLNDNLLEGNRKYKAVSNSASSGFVLNDGGTAVYYPQSGNVDIEAYYPYKAGITNFSYPVDVSDQATPSAIDLMYSKNAMGITKRPSVVNLEFSHKLTKVTINTIKGNELSNAEFDAISVSITGLNTKADFKFIGGTFDNLNTPAAITPVKSGAQYTALLIPQETAAGKVKFTIPGVDIFEWTINTAVFAGGKHYTYNITVGKTGVALSTSDIIDWDAADRGTGTTIEFSEIVKIPAGIFLMGSSDGRNSNGTPGEPNYTPAEPGRWGDEEQHRVRLTKDFYMSKYEITNVQYAAFLNAVGVDNTGIGKVSYHMKGTTYTESQRFIYPDLMGVTYGSGAWKVESNYEKHPVIQVTWYGAKAYADWVGGSLPTEAQWEYACRAGTTTAYFSGDSISSLANYAWYSGNSNNTTHAVGTKLANDFGLYDMHGNVLEWCADWFSYYTKWGSGDVDDIYIDPQGPDIATYRVLRGGGFLETKDGCRSASRSGTFSNPDFFNPLGPPLSIIGFRVVFN